MRRQFGLVLLLGAAGAALVVFAVRQTWAQAVFTPPRPLPAQEISGTGQQPVPLASAAARGDFGPGTAACPAGQRAPPGPAGLPGRRDRHPIGGSPRGRGPARAP